MIAPLARSIRDRQALLSASTDERGMKGQRLGRRPSRAIVYRVPGGPGVASHADHAIYQLRIDGLLVSRAQTTMPMMRTPKEAGGVIMLSGLFAVLLVGTLAGSVETDSGRDCYRTSCYPSYSRDYYGCGRCYGYGAYDGCYRGYAGCDGPGGCVGYGRCGSYGDYGGYGWSGR
jgi:hypothetical protein